MLQVQTVLEDMQLVQKDLPVRQCKPVLKDQLVHKYPPVCDYQHVLVPNEQPVRQDQLVCQENLHSATHLYAKTNL